MIKNHYWQRKLLNHNKKFNERLLSYSKISKTDSEKIFKEYVEVIDLETSSYCNRSCVYCPVATYGRKNKELNMSDATLNSIFGALKKINYDKSFIFNLYNEPLANKMFFNVLERFKKELPKATFTTNSNGDYIKNINVLKKLDKLGLNEIKITLHTPPKGKWNISSREKALKRIAKRINFNLNDNHLKNLAFTFKLNNLNCLIHCINYAEEGMTRGGEIDFLRRKEIRSAPCVRPFRKFTIYYDGYVTPCCDIFHDENYKKYDVGRILPDNPDSIFNIYLGKNLTMWRKSLFDYSLKKEPCASCRVIDFANPAEDLEIRKKILKKFK